MSKFRSVRCGGSDAAITRRGTRMIYELRLYEVAHGRLSAEVQRMYEVAIADHGGADRPSLFDRHGVPRPLFAWTTVSGTGLPGFGYLLRWPGIMEREKCFPSFWADPEWLEIKDRTDDGSPMVERMDDYYIGPSSFWNEDLAGTGKEPGRVQDIVLQEVSQGWQQLAARRFVEIDAPFLRSKGARILGLFDILIGSGIPSLVTFIDWPDPESRQAAWTSHHEDAGIVQARVEEERQCGRPLFEFRRQLQVEPCAFAPAPSGSLIE